MSKRILIIEGPAGSGKTTVINRISSLWNSEIIYTPWINRPRAYIGSEGEIMAFTKDMVSLIKAKIDTPLKQERVIIDRCILSSWVYDRIRYPEVTPPKLGTLYNLTLDMVSIGMTQLFARSAVKNVDDNEIRFLIMLPSVHTIEDRRKQTGREFPYTAIEEHSWYDFLQKEHLFYTITGNENDNTLVEVVEEVFRHDISRGL